MRDFDIAVERWPIAGGFTISRGSRTEATVVVARIASDGASSMGECVPYAHYGESARSVVAQMQSVASDIRGGANIDELQGLLPPGAARNAIDCALWGLNAAIAGKPLHKLAGFDAPRPLITAYTISLGTPETMYEAASRAAQRPLLKVKLGGEGDPERVAAIREAAPDARLIVDANESWRDDTLAANLLACEAASVELIEQPLPADGDDALARILTDITICADESIHDHTSLARLPPWYDAINIKLDKTGGLTNALALLAAAQERGLKIMIGCMLGTSLGIAPAIVLAQKAQFVDLDGPLLLAKDREGGIRYVGSVICP